MFRRLNRERLDGIILKTHLAQLSSPPFHIGERQVTCSWTGGRENYQPNGSFGAGRGGSLVVTRGGEVFRSLRRKRESSRSARRI